MNDAAMAEVSESRAFFSFFFPCQLFSSRKRERERDQKTTLPAYPSVPLTRFTEDKTAKKGPLVSRAVKSKVIKVLKIKVVFVQREKR